MFFFFIEMGKKFERIIAAFFNRFHPINQQKQQQKRDIDTVKVHFFLNWC